MRGIKKIYLAIALKYFKYIKIPPSLFLLWTIEQYNLKTLALDGWVYIEMRKIIWGLPQASILANKCICRKLTPFGYFECINTPGLWCHESRPITFTLVVDNFGVKYVNRDDVDHIILSMKKTYTFTKDWTGNLYCRMQENMADYQNMHRIGSHHIALQPWYLRMQDSPRVLTWAERPSALKGCVGTLHDGCICDVPLPGAPQIQHASHVTTVTRDTCY